MISAVTGRWAVGMIGRAQFGTTTRMGQSKFVESWCATSDKGLIRKPLQQWIRRY